MSYCNETKQCYIKENIVEGQFVGLSLQELRQSVQLLLSTKIAVYLMTFLIVTVAWAAHIR